MKVEKGYIGVDSGQIHFRHAGERSSPSICLFHASPGSSRQLTELISTLSKKFFVYAPDTPGNGLSDPLPMEQPEIFDYAKSHLQALNNMGIKNTVLFGTHTGASIAACISQMPQNPGSLLILDSVGLYDLEEKKPFTFKLRTKEKSKFNR